MTSRDGKFFLQFFFTFYRKNKFYKVYFRGRWFRISRFYVHSNYSFYRNPRKTWIIQKISDVSEVIKRTMISMSLMPNITVLCSSGLKFRLPLEKIFFQSFLWQVVSKILTKYSVLIDLSHNSLFMLIFYAFNYRKSY